MATTCVSLPALLRTCSVEWSPEVQTSILVMLSLTQTCLIDVQEEHPGRP